jgi:[ribosomal protein S18]-alanine N-acetyltransferase
MNSGEETPHFRIAVVKASDLNDIMRIEHQSFGIDAYPREEFVWLRRLGRETFLVARQDSKVVGYIAAFMIERNGYIASTAVAPRYRQQGIGSALIAAVRERFSMKGAEALTLHVREANERAVRLYEQQGFVVETTVPSYYEDGAPALYMKLLL